MGEVQQRFPGARRALFTRYHIGGCSSCGYGEQETLAEVCGRNENLPVDEVIAHIETSHEEDEKLRLSPLEAKARIDGEGSGEVALLDIRTREEYDAVKIPGSELLTQELMQEMMNSWPKDRTIILVDHRGERSLDAVAFIAGHGFTNIRAVRGGIDAWSQEVDPDLPRYHIES